MMTRFAPSPTGFLHLGHARAAQRAFGFAQKHNGACLLRIEDIDHMRCKPEFTAAIYEDLRWLGFDWPQPVRVQSEHKQDYEGVITALAARGLIYRCFSTRREIAAQSDEDGVYRGPEFTASRDEELARIADGEAFAWRLSLSRARDELGERFEALSYTEIDYAGRARGERPAHANRFGDEVIARRDIGVSYHLAVTHDDAAQEVTHIVRGADLRALTGFHVLLQALMGWPTPLYHHHKLIKTVDGEKLAKRRGSLAIRALREAGHSPEQVLEMAKSNLSR